MILLELVSGSIPTPLLVLLVIKVEGMPSEYHWSVPAIDLVDSAHRVKFYYPTRQGNRSGRGPDNGKVQ